MEKRYTHAVSILFLGFAIRSITAFITTITNLNPESQADAIEFENTAEAIAKGLLHGNPYQFTPDSIDVFQLIFPSTPADTYTLWGSFLAPFWILPGPSGFYARLWLAFLGTYAIYNVYLLGRYYHSHQAGVFAVLPMIFYPSFVAVQSTLLREAMVLFGITTAARLLMISSKSRSRAKTYLLAAFILHIVLLLRSDNVFIFFAAVITGIGVYVYQSGHLSKRIIGIGLALSAVAYLISLPTIKQGIDFLAYIRRVRAKGRTVYLPEVIPQTVTELIAFSWIGAAYFLYAPFPWMVETIPDLLISMEGMITLGFTLAAVWGMRSLNHKNSPATVGLLVGLAVAIVLYGVGTVNYGTGMRHRQMFTWVIYLFGGIGISEYVNISWPFQGNNILPSFQY